MRNNPVQSSWMNDPVERDGRSSWTNPAKPLAGQAALFPDSTSRQPYSAGTDETIKKGQNGSRSGTHAGHRCQAGGVYLLELMF